MLLFFRNHIFGPASNPAGDVFLDLAAIYAPDVELAAVHAPILDLIAVLPDEP